MIQSKSAQDTLPETKTASENGPGTKGKFHLPTMDLGDGGYVSFRERQTSKFKHVKSANSRPEAYYFSKLRIPG